MAVTQDKVSEACERIAATGDRPTVDKVRRELGNGSLSTITPMVRAWREGQQGSSGMPSVEERSSTTEPAPLPTVVQRALEQISAAVAGLPQAIAAAITEAAATERRSGRLELDAAEAAARKAINEYWLTAEDERGACDAMRAEVDHMAATLGEREHEIAALRESLDATKLELERMTGARDEAYFARDEAKHRARALADDVYEARKETAVAQEAAKAARAELAKLRTESAKLTAELDDARESAASLRTMVAVQRQRADGEQQRAERAEADAERNRQERAASEAAAHEALARVALIEVGAAHSAEGDHGSPVTPSG